MRLVVPPVAPLGGVTHRIAAFVRARIFPNVHVVLDLHAGGRVARFMPCASFHEVPNPALHALTEATARDFGTPLVLTYQNQTPGLLTSKAEALGKIALGCELGWGAAIQPDGVRFGRRGVMSAAIRHGLYRGATPPLHDLAQIRAEIIDGACFIPAPFSGHYEPLCSCGEQVRAGDVAGLLHDFERLDLEPTPIRAGVTGIVVAHAWEAVVRQGQHVLVVGQRVPFAG